MNKRKYAGIALSGSLLFGIVVNAAQSESSQRKPSIDPNPIPLVHCYDFDNLEVGRRYEVGDTVQAQNAEIRLAQYIVNGVPSTAAAQFAEVQNSQIAGGPAPELRTYLINPRIILETPAEMVTYKFAEGAAGGDHENGPHSNLGVNFDFREVDGTLRQLDGELMGSPNVGQVRVSVDAAPSDEGNWNKGTLKLEAVSGKIKTVTFGGRQVYLDKVCTHIRKLPTKRTLP